MFIHESAAVAAEAAVGEGTEVWHQAQLMPDVSVGAGCTIGKGAFLGAGTRVGDQVKVGNYANLFGPTVEEGAFRADGLPDGRPATHAPSTRTGRAKGPTTSSGCRSRFGPGPRSGAGLSSSPG